MGRFIRSHTIGCDCGSLFHVPAVIQNLDQPDPGRIELLDHAHGVVVVALVHFVALERWPNEDGNDEFLLLRARSGREETSCRSRCLFLPCRRG